MNFVVLELYVQVCFVMKVNPSFKGLAEFSKFYKWESNNYGRC